MNLNLSEEQIEKIIKHQSDKIDDLEAKISKVKGYIAYYIENKGELGTKKENLTEIRDLLR